MCRYPSAKKKLTLYLERGEGRERYFGCNLMQRKVLASSYQHLMAEAPHKSGDPFSTPLTVQRRCSSVPQHEEFHNNPFQPMKWKVSTGVDLHLRDAFESYALCRTGFPLEGNDWNSPLASNRFARFARRKPKRGENWEFRWLRSLSTDWQTFALLALSVTSSLDVPGC